MEIYMMEFNKISSINLDCNNQLMKADEVANYLNVSLSFAYRLLQKGIIPTVRLGKARRVRPQDLNDFVDQNIHDCKDNH
jgi:excisionase family DNA binding protein